MQKRMNPVPDAERRFNNPAQGPIAMMRFEHEQHGEGLDELMRLTNDITPPTGACDMACTVYRSDTNYVKT